MTRLIIRTVPTWRSRALLGGGVAAVLLAGWLLFEYGRYTAGYDLLGVQAEMDDLVEQLDNKGDEVDALRDQVAVLERSTLIDSESNRKVSETIASQQAEIVELKGELAFYRGIIASKNSNGLSLQGFTVRKGGNDTAFHYKMVLTQGLSNSAVAAGSVSITLAGYQDGVVTVVPLKEIVTDAAAADLAFKFKYFQNFEGDLVLPEGFIPSKVVVTVTPTTRQLQEFTEEYTWAVQEES